MDTELEAMESNNAPTIQSLPNEKIQLGVSGFAKLNISQIVVLSNIKFVQRRKGIPNKRLGFYRDIFHVAKLVTVKMLLAIAVGKGWFLFQLNVNNAFLNGDLFEEVYMDLTLGYSKHRRVNIKEEKLFCRLHKSVNGLKQASRQWFSKFSQYLVLNWLV